MHEPLAPRPRLDGSGRRPSGPVLLWAVPAFLALSGVAIWYLLLRAPETPEPSAGVAPPAPVVEPEPPPRVSDLPQVPAVEPEPEIPLPPLDQSDEELASVVTEFFGPQVVEQYLRPEGLIRNLVVTIDNLARSSLALERRPIQPTPGVFIVTGSEDAPILSEENYSRYTPFVTLVARTNARTLVSLYRRYYPLMQEAYVELGNPDTVFDARVLEVIDHLLAAPDIEGRIELVQPNVLYQFKDPTLEQLSPGQKILVRMGPEHAAVIKTKLRELRAALVAGPEE